MMGNKKNKPNAYSIFMEAMKPVIEKRLGRHVQMAEVADLVAAEWRNMTPEEKQKYKPYKTGIKLDSFGVPLAVHEERKERMRKIKEEMLTGIQYMVDICRYHNDFGMLELVVIAVTDYVTTDEGKVFPAEISLVKLNLKDGVNPKQYHVICKPPVPHPVGYLVPMRNRVLSTHRLPFDPDDPLVDCIGTDLFEEVAGEMLSFLGMTEDPDKSVSVFTLEENLDITRQVLSDSFSLGHINVWCLEELLRLTFTALFPDVVSVYTNTHARDCLVNSPNSLEFHPFLGCKWHREEQPNETNFCSLNMAQRWAYMFLHALQLDKTLKISLLPGRHWPGANPHCGVVVDLSSHDLKRKIRRQTESLASSIYSLPGASTSSLNCISNCGKKPECKSANSIDRVAKEVSGAPLPDNTHWLPCPLQDDGTNLATFTSTEVFSPVVAPLSGRCDTFVAATSMRRKMFVGVGALHKCTCRPGDVMGGGCHDSAVDYSGVEVDSGAKETGIVEDLSEVRPVRRTASIQSVALSLLRKSREEAAERNDDAVNKLRAERDAPLKDDQAVDVLGQRLELLHVKADSQSEERSLPISFGRGCRLKLN